MKIGTNRTSLRRPYQILMAMALLGISGLSIGQSLEDALRAALDGELAVVQRQVERGASPDTSDREGNTLMMLAARSGHTPVVSYLIQNKAAVNQKNTYGDTALMAAALKGHVEVAKLLIANGAEVNGSGNWSPLHYAAFEGRAPMVRLLLDHGADKNALAPNEYTPLMLAVRNGHEDAARSLLQGDPDVNYQTRSGGDTALKLAVKKGFEPVVSLLKRAGAVQ